ncbi:hypothetical protein [Actinomadura rudentiformis]|uniref:Uncharacterized protein n=1 Tax=Actinomadura rudentiformis TaxID=359158 RepID=A0A6H9YQX7_9ACTN|nr:hypothetical protein [Actinomadura rudentiformis]KAB2348968.1 hypothetical protein F8566_14550 [Actinomadura rudentiformis]
MLAIVAAIVFGIALLLDLADYASDALNYQTLIVVGLLLLALHMAGFGTSTNWRGRSWSRTRRR